MHDLVDTVGRLVVVASGQARFMVIEHSTEPGRTFDEITFDEMVKWTPYSWLRPLIARVHEGINQILVVDRKAVGGDLLNPRSIVADEFARRLDASGQFQEILTMVREPRAEERRRVDALLRLTVPRWGLVRVREGDPPLVSAFVDVHAQMILRETGVVAWELREDVTHPDRVPLKAFTAEREFARGELLEVLERAGHRLANELLYARTARP
jgi:hypothetical protein